MSAAKQEAAEGPPRARILALVAIIALVIAALSAIDSFLENAEQSELRSQAQQSYIAGSRLLSEGKRNEAVEALRKAHALERRNDNYEISLIEALMAAGKADEAESLMNETLLREPNDGRANLIAARLMSKKGMIADAESYYHRAIYGEWPDNAAAHRTSARLELIDFLVATGQKGELLAELLPLEDEAGKNTSIEKRLARLFLIAGSPSRAADAYRVLIRKGRNDAASYAGLGEAELELGDYHAAHAAFREASHLKPGDAGLRGQLQLSATLTALDPTPRRLPSMEKYHRSLRVLELASGDLEQCVVNHPEVATGETAQLLKEAENAVAGRAPAHVTNEVAEGILELSERIWQARIQSCGSGTAADEEPTRLIMEKLAQ